MGAIHLIITLQETAAPSLFSEYGPIGIMLSLVLIALSYIFRLLINFVNDTIKDKNTQINQLRQEKENEEKARTERERQRIAAREAEGEKARKRDEWIVSQFKEIANSFSATAKEIQQQQHKDTGELKETLSTMTKVMTESVRSLELMHNKYDQQGNIEKALDEIRRRQ